jgi:competence protein ComEA
MEKIDWSAVWEGHKTAVIFGLVGLLLISFGILGILMFRQKEPEIEILPAQSEQVSSTIWVDLEGAVENPGVYELTADSRLNDLLIRAGGLSAEADRDWVESNLNLAQKLVDGAKIYIPEQSSATQSPVLPGEVGQVSGLSAANKININTASAAQLDSLWGIGAARATDIIKGRPYTSIEELLSRKIIPSNVYERIKDEISVF